MMLNTQFSSKVDLSGFRIELASIHANVNFCTFTSSFDEYSTEVKSGRLEWSPVHKSEKFWRENAARLNEKNYELLK